MAVKNKKERIKKKRHIQKIKKSDIKKRKLVFLENHFLFSLGITFFIFSFFFIILSPSRAKADSAPVITRNSIIRYAASGVGSPYVWGGDKWNPNNRKWGGADCSGLVIKAWQIPRKAAYTKSVGHPYNTYSFYYKSNHWYSINRSNLAKGDILVYRNKNSGHVVIYHYGDKWGSPVVYEARSRKTGIIHGQRYFPSSYKARRRRNLVDSEPGLMASVRISAKNQIYSTPNTYAARNMYFGYFNKKDVLYIRNANQSVSLTANAILQNRRLLNIKQISLGAYAQNKVAEKWRANGYLRIATSGPKAYAFRQDRLGYRYLAKDRTLSASSNFITYFEPRNDLLYLNNINTRTVRATIILYNNNKTYHKKTIRIKRRSVALVSYKRSSLRRLKSAYVRVNTKGGRVFVNKKTRSSYIASAQPSSKLSRLLYLSNFDPSKNLLYITNPTRKKARVLLKYIQNGRSYYAKRLYIRPHDVILVDKRKRLKHRKSGFIKIESSQVLLASRRMASSTYQLAQPSSFISKTLNIASFNPSKELLIMTNPVGVNQKATVNIYANSTLVFSSTYNLTKNRQQLFDFRNTSAAAYSGTYVNITASL